MRADYYFYYKDDGEGGRKRRQLEVSQELGLIRFPCRTEFGIFVGAPALFVLGRHQVRDLICFGERGASVLAVTAFRRHQQRLCVGPKSQSAGYISVGVRLSQGTGSRNTPGEDYITLPLVWPAAFCGRGCRGNFKSCRQKCWLLATVTAIRNDGKQLSGWRRRG